MPLEGFEPPADSIEASCSSVELQGHGGSKGTRTPGPLLAKQTLFQLSYAPMCALGEIRTPILLIRSQSLYPFSYKRISTATRTRTASLQGENLAC